MADLKISALNSLAGADLVAADVVAVVDDSASETKKLTVSDLIANGVTLISNSTIPSAKILFSAGAIDTAELAASAVETAKIDDSAVTAAKLADNSSVTLVSSLPASGDFTGQIALDTTNDKIYIWDGSAWDSVKGAGSINVVNGSTSGIVNITTTTSGDTVTVSTTLDDTSAAANFLAGPTGAGGTVGYRAIAGSDLPKATTSTKGAVVVNGNGLTMSNDEIQINNSVTAETTNHHVVQYDANGLITAGRQITGADIPSATSSVKGSVFPGTGLAVTAAGELNHSNNITGGTFTKVTVDTEGHVTATTDLVASDIPDLPASKITTGTLPTARLANDAITADKLANESTTKFIGAGATDNVVTFPDGDFKGQFAYDEKNEDLYVYTGNSFIPITVISGNLVNAGTYNANTNLISSVTTAGSAAGFTSGGSLPTPATTNLNYYVVVDTSGTGSGAAPSVSLAPPDMLVSLGTGATFQLVDVSNAIAGQTAANISVVPVGSVAATDAQAAIQELDTEKLPKAGGTMTGNLELGAGIVIVFEGATANDYETTLTCVDATADRTITLPDETGTVLTTGSSGVVTSTMITDGTIVNADISASAEIAVSKLANGTARQLLQTDSTGADVEFTSNIDVPGTLDCTGAGTFDSSLTVTGVINADGKVKFPAGTAALPSFYSGTDTNTGLYFSAADEISVSTGGTQRVVVDSSGNVGIGASSPGSYSSYARNLVVNETGNAGISISSTDSSSNVSSIQFTGGTTRRHYIECTNGSNGNFTFQTEGTGAFRFIDGSGERARINGSGKLLVGTSSDYAENVQAAFYGASNGGIALASGTSGLSRLMFADATAGNAGAYVGSIIYSHADNSLRFNVNGGSEAARIDSSGRLLLGTTTEGAVNADDLTIATNGDTGITIRSSASGYGNLFFSDATSGSGEYAGYVQYNHNNNSLAVGANTSTRLTIDSSGRVGIGTTSPGQPLAVVATSSTYKGMELITPTGDGSGEFIFGVHQNGSTAGRSIVFKRGGSDGTASESLRIDSSGNVGINTTSPSRTLHVLKNDVAAARIGGSTYAIEIGQLGSSSSPGFNAVGGSSMLFRMAGTEAMRINSSGQLLIGTTTEGQAYADNLTIADSGHCGLTIRSGTSGVGSIYFSDATSGPGEYDGFIQYNQSTRVLQFGSATSTRLLIDSSGVVTVKNGAVAEIDALTDAATITPDLAASCNFSVTLGGNRTLANPSNITAGQSGSIFVTQDGTGSRTLAFGSYWDFAGGTAPTLTTTASAVDRIDYIVRSSTSIHAVATLAYS